MAGTQVMVDVPVRLQVMQASVDEIKRILNHLEPDSSGFKKLSKTLAEMTAQMEKFQMQTSKPFGSQAQFNQASKTVEKMEESLAKAKIQIEGLKFSDIIEITVDEYTQATKGCVRLVVNAYFDAKVAREDAFAYARTRTIS